MKKQIGLYILFMASLAMMLVYHGCSELENDLVAPESPGVHGAGWLNSSSANFHGKYIASQKWDLSSCKTCHANDYTGGSIRLDGVELRAYPKHALRKQAGPWTITPA